MARLEQRISRLEGARNVSPSGVPEQTGTWLLTVKDETGNRRFWPAECGLNWPKLRQIARRTHAFARDRWCPRGWCRIVALPCRWVCPGAP